jgi:hypothetical protein
MKYWETIAQASCCRSVIGLLQRDHAERLALDC